MTSLFILLGSDVMRCMRQKSIGFATKTNSFYNFQLNLVILLMCKCANVLMCKPLLYICLSTRSTQERWVLGVCEAHGGGGGGQIYIYVQRVSLLTRNLYRFKIGSD